MTKNVLAALGAAFRALVRHIPALAVLALLYALFIGACYFLVTTREATLWQVGFTFVFAVAVPLLFCALQAGCAAFAVGADAPGATLKGAARGFWKVLLVSLPLVLLVVCGVWALNKVEARLKAKPAAETMAGGSHGDVTEDEGEVLSVPANEQVHEDEPARKPKVRWSFVLLVAVRLLLFGLVLPLVALRLWLGLARGGFRTLFKGFGRVLAPESVLTYAVGAVLFGVIPYFLLFTRTGTGSAWSELTLFGLRLLLAFLCSLAGWVLTMRALAHPAGTDAALAPSEANAPQPAPTGA
ncbi:MAG TPA: hypothetical protein VF546_21545 [Pyrinomonadaceae bacterium]|jgi:hypothetical protein